MKPESIVNEIQHNSHNQWWIYIVKCWMHAPPQSKLFQFHAVLGNIWQNHMLAPPWEIYGSVTDNSIENQNKNYYYS